MSPDQVEVIICHCTCALILIIAWVQASLSMRYFNVVRFIIFFIVFLGLDFTLFSLVISILCCFVSRFRNGCLHHVFE